MFRMKKLKFVRRIHLKKKKIKITRTVELLTNTNNMKEVGMENNGKNVDWKLLMDKSTLSGKEREFIERKLYETCRNKKVYKSNTNWNSIRRKKQIQKQMIHIMKTHPRNTIKSEDDEELKQSELPVNPTEITNRKSNDELAIIKPDSPKSRPSVDIGKQKFSLQGSFEQRNSKSSMGSGSHKTSIMNIPEKRNSKSSVGSVSKKHSIINTSEHRGSKISVISGSKKTSITSVSEHRRSRTSIDHSRKKFASEQRYSKVGIESGLMKVPSILVVDRNSKIHIDRLKVNALVMANMKSRSSNESVKSKVTANTLPVDHNSKSADSISKTSSVPYDPNRKSSSSKSMLNGKRIPVVKKGAARLYVNHTHRWIAKHDKLRRPTSLSSGRSKSLSSRSSMLEKFEMYTKRVMGNSISRYMLCGSQEKKATQWIHVPTSWLVDCIKIMDAVNDVVQWSCLGPLFGIVRNNFESIKFDFHDLFPRHRMVSIFERLKPQITIDKDSDSSKDESVTSLRSGFSSLYGYHF